MNKHLSAIVVTMLTLCFVVLGNIILNKPPILNAEYINAEVLTTDSIDKMLFTSKSENYIACLCSVSNDEMMFLILKNDKTFSLHFKETFTLNGLTEDASKIMTDEMFLSKKDVIYNIFLNPNIKTISINNENLPVNTIEYNKYTIGFWWSEIE